MKKFKITMIIEEDFNTAEEMHRNFRFYFDVYDTYVADKFEKKEFVIEKVKEIKEERWTKLY